MMEAPPHVVLRRATRDDGPTLWRLAGECPPLERNTVYAYVLLAERFAETTFVAEDDGRAIGYLLGIRSPTRPDVLFVWQLGVLPSHRGLGLGGRLLAEAVDRNADVVSLETTVARNNAASEALFRGFARTRETGCAVLDGHLPAALLGHAAEDDTERLFHIGPLRRGPA